MVDRCFWWWRCWGRRGLVYLMLYGGYVPHGIDGPLDYEAVLGHLQPALVKEDPLAIVSLLVGQWLWVLHVRLQIECGLYEASSWLITSQD